MTKPAGSTTIPSLRYRDAHAAIEWLVRAFGFERQAVYPGPDNTVAHAQLTLGGTGMIMLGPVDNEGEFGRLMVEPSAIGNRETKGVYLVVSDADQVHATALAAGAEMVLEIRDMDYGGRGFTCRDLEGHLWSVGTYNPWHTEGS
ncbi:MAG: glyoxalase [Acidobacteriota bacterium]|nr:glyoxalase [Acidobacteriota bacterium]